MNEKEKNTVEELEKQLRLSMNVDDITTTIRNDEAQIILNLIEKLQKENELAKKQVEYDKTHIFTPQTIKLNYIPIQTVKDKIEELQNGPLKINENNKYYYETEAYNKIIIQVLQELLEGRK